MQIIGQGNTGLLLGLNRQQTNQGALKGIQGNNAQIGDASTKNLNSSSVIENNKIGNIKRPMYNDPGRMSEVLTPIRGLADNTSKGSSSGGAFY